MSPSVTASTNPIITMSTVNPSTTTTTSITSSNYSVTSTITTISTTIIVTNPTTTGKPICYVLYASTEYIMQSPS